MNGYERLIKIMQNQNKKPSAINLAIMDTATSCTVNGLKLDAEDLLVADHLKTGWYKPAGEKFQYVEPVKAGDMVLIVKVNDEKYAIMERLVME